MGTSASFILPFRIMIFHSDAGESIRVSIRGRTFISTRIIIGTVQIKTEDLLGNTEIETGGMYPYLRSCRKGASAHYAFEASFNMDRSNPGKPSITIRVSARRSDAQEHATMQAQAAQTAIDSGDLKPVDPESALENSFSKLSDTLGEVVKVTFEKMDILAEVGFYHKRVIVLCPDRLPYQQLHPYANIAWKACSSLYRVGPS